MITEKYEWKELGVTADIALFAQPDKVTECHAMLQVTPQDDLFEAQWNRLQNGLTQLMTQLETYQLEIVAKRYFLSDSVNQAEYLQTETDGFTSVIQQSPLNGSKVALWLYLQQGTQITRSAHTTLCRHNGYSHLWHSNMHTSQGSSAEQTTELLTHYEQELTHHGASLAAHCVRTWFYVRDIDTQYKGMVVARRENFLQQGLTPQTHYIASTGICGGPADIQSIIQLDAYALLGRKPAQQQFLYALTHLNPTIEYGVTFERGTAIHYGDRSQLFISGTASIDNKGNVLHCGNIVAQTHRMWENVESLLAEGGATAEDIMQMIVYLRDAADYACVDRLFSAHYPNTPRVIVLAPVCRPTWLIEMECIAVVPDQHSDYTDF